VWDYPRPPRLEEDPRRVVVRAGGIVVADTTRAVRVLETASPPTFYLPPEDVDRSLLREAEGRSVCEWKGWARYWDVDTGEGQVRQAAWSYDDPWAGFEPVAGYLAFYAGKLDCRVDDERVRPQPGGFYGGWVTSEIVGPMKGEPGTGHW
jgi:uncharacterized protein (DUF427 family)